MEEQKKQKTIADSEPQKQGIDFMKLWNLGLKHRKLYYKVLGIAFVVALVIVFSIPRPTPAR